MLRWTALLLLCVCVVGSALADPIVGEQAWRVGTTEIVSGGLTIFGNLPEPGGIIEEVAMRTNFLWFTAFPCTLTVIPPDYAGGPAPMSDVFFSLSLSEVDCSTESVFWIEYNGGSTLEVYLSYGDVQFLDLWIEAVAVRTSDPSAIIEAPDADLALSARACTPNPFQSSTRLVYRIDEASADEPVEIRILDAAGRAQRTLFRGYQSPGVHVLTWDGRNDSGGKVGHGVYFIRIQNGSNNLQRRVTVVR